MFLLCPLSPDSGISLRDQIKILSPSTANEKLLADKIPASSAAVNPPSDGIVCNDFDPKTINDIFSAGVCSGTNVEGQVCDDENIQTIEDKYVSGVCVGNNVEGQVCDDKNAQTINDKYINGVCLGTNVEGQACNDGNAQTINDKYVSGVCMGTNVEGQTCNDSKAYTYADKYTSGICSGTIATSCFDIKTITGTGTSGTYNIDVDASGVIAPINVYCDMVIDILPIAKARGF